jgi:hypothetical protein
VGKGGEGGEGHFVTPISRALKMTCGHALHLPLQVLLKRWTYFLSTSLTSYFLNIMLSHYTIIKMSSYEA